MFSRPMVVLCEQNTHVSSPASSLDLSRFGAVSVQILRKTKSHKPRLRPPSEPSWKVLGLDSMCPTDASLGRKTDKSEWRPVASPLWDLAVH